MASYQESRMINASADQVFDFVADVRNMPHYLPTTHNAEPQGEGRVRLQGEVKGHEYDSDGYLNVDRQNYRLEWGADERYYSGWMEIEPQGNRTNVKVEITLRRQLSGADSNESANSQQIQEGLRAALESIEQQLTGQGGKVEPSAVSRQRQPVPSM